MTMKNFSATFQKYADNILSTMNTFNYYAIAGLGIFSLAIALDKCTQPKYEPEEICRRAEMSRVLSNKSGRGENLHGLMTSGADLFPINGQMMNDCLKRFGINAP